MTLPEGGMAMKVVENHFADAVDIGVAAFDAGQKIAKDVEGAFDAIADVFIKRGAKYAEDAIKRNFLGATVECRFEKNRLWLRLEPADDFYIDWFCEENPGVTLRSALDRGLEFMDMSATETSKYFLKMAEALEREAARIREIIGNAAQNPPTHTGG